MKVIKGSKITKKYAPYYTTLSNAYSRLEEFSENPGPTHETQTKNQTVLPKHQSASKRKSARRLQTKFGVYISKMNDNDIIDLYINKAKDERTVMGKNDLKNARRVTIDAAHAATGKPKPNNNLLQQGKNVGYAISTIVRRLLQNFKHNNQQVRFANKPTVARFHKRDDTTMITYYSGADHHYMSEADRIGLGFPILRSLKKLVGVANGDTRTGK